MIARGRKKTVGETKYVFKCFRLNPLTECVHIININLEFIFLCFGAVY